MGHTELGGGIRARVIALLCAAALAAQCTGSAGTVRLDGVGQADAVAADAVDNKEVVAEGGADMAVCPVDWAKLAYTNEYSDYPVATDRTNFVRPFFTMCEDGGFYWNEWQFFPDGIDAKDANSFASFASCLSGECKWGICKEDADYFEKRLKGYSMGGKVRLVTPMCRPCNPNNAAYSQKLDPDGGGDCEGGQGCCSEPGPWEAPDGPCLHQRSSGFSYGVLDPASSFGFVNYFRQWYSEDELLPEDCKSQPESPCPVQRGARCVPGTSTLVSSDWVARGGVVFYAGQRSAITKVRITMGAISRVGALLSDQPVECPAGDKRKEASLEYFTCSGMAEIQDESGAWYRIVWVQKYDPAKCDKPCWLAAGADPEGVAVEFTMEPIPAEEGW